MTPETTNISRETHQKASMMARIFGSSIIARFPKVYTQEELARITAELGDPSQYNVIFHSNEHEINHIAHEENIYTSYDDGKLKLVTILTKIENLRVKQTYLSKLLKRKKKEWKTIKQEMDELTRHLEVLTQRSNEKTCPALFVKTKEGRDLVL